MNFTLRVEPTATNAQLSAALRWWGRYLEEFGENPGDCIVVTVPGTGEPHPTYGAPWFSHSTDGYCEDLFYAPDHREQWNGFVSSEAIYGEGPYATCPVHGAQFWAKRQPKDPEGLVLDLACGCRLMPT